MHNVLITGANGFIGSALCRRMVAEGWKVRGALRYLTKKNPLPQQIDIVEIGTIDSNTEWEPVLEGHRHSGSPGRQSSRDG